MFGKKQTSLILLFLLFNAFVSSAQDTIVLLNGKKIVASSVDLKDYTIAYRANKPKSKLRTIDPFRVFSIVYKDGHERLIYQSDSLDPLDFKPEEMRLFVYGSQDAKDIYKNNLIKGAGFVIGGGGALLAFYGLVVPPLYATGVGTFSPIVEKKLTFKVGGEAAAELGIAENKYMNIATGSVSQPVVKKGQTLNVGHSSIRFKEDSPVDTVVSLINEKFNSHRVHAKNEDGKIKLYRSTRGAMISENPYREGFEKKIRDYKIRRGMISALAGFVTGIALGVVLN